MKLALHKTEILILKGQIKRKNIHFRTDDNEIFPSGIIQYLGTNFDETSDVSKTYTKAEEHIPNLTGLMLITEGSNSIKRAAMCFVAYTTILFDALV